MKIIDSVCTCCKWTNQDKATAISLGLTGSLCVIASVFSFIERSYFCYGSVCESSQTNETWREIWHWTIFGCTAVGTITTIVAWCFFKPSGCCSNNAYSHRLNY